jgi:hypothetical protein
MEKTSLGLTRLAPGEGLNTDNWSFQDQNPKIINALLEYAAFRHRHDAHAALPAPIDPPTADTGTNGGTIPSDTTVYVGYTLTDADGGETMLNPEPVVVTTQGGLDTPIDAPDVATFHDAGTLVAGSYRYAITVTDGLGGETALGPAITIVVPPGNASSRNEISGLAALVADSGGTGYRLWRSVNGGPWGLISSGAADLVNDDGSLCADCKNVTPPIRTGSTNATNTLLVTVPAVAPNTQATSFSIYATTDGTFGNPSLLGTYPIADLGTEKTYTSLDFLDGAPPEANQTFPGAQPVNADTDIINLRVKAPVATAGDLPTEDNRDGDLRVTLDDHHLHVWDATAVGWGDLATGGAVPTGVIVQDEGAALPQRGTLDFVGDGVVATDDAATGRTIVTITGVPGPAGGLTWQGVWDVATDYAVNDVVRTTDVDGVEHLWVAVADPAIGDEPGVAAAWEVLIDAATGGGGGGGGTGGFSRQNVVVNVSGDADAALPRGYRLLKVHSDLATRVRLYTRADKRAADVARPSNTPPTGADHGVIFDADLDADSPLTMTPAIDGWNDDDVVADVGYARIDPAAVGTVPTVTLTLVQTEV